MPTGMGDLGGVVKRKYADKDEFSERMRRGKMAHDDARELRRAMGYDEQKASKLDRDRQTRRKKGGKR